MLGNWTTEEERHMNDEEARPHERPEVIPPVVSEDHLTLVRIDGRWQVVNQEAGRGALKRNENFAIYLSAQSPDLAVQTILLKTTEKPNGA